MYVLVSTKVIEELSHAISYYTHTSCIEGVCLWLHNMHATFYYANLQLAN